MFAGTVVFIGTCGGGTGALKRDSGGAHERLVETSGSNTSYQIECV